MFRPKEKLPTLPDIELKNTRITMRPPRAEDWPAWRDMRGRNETYLKPFEPRWPKESLTEDFFYRRLLRQKHDWDSGQGQSFLIFCHENAAPNPQLIGGININHICRGAAHYASLGYWIDEAHQGRGYMRQALETTLQYAFSELKLNRVHASCVPHNTRSKKLLLAGGFKEEGVAEKYLQIDGIWQDHILFGYTHERWSAQNQA